VTCEQFMAARGQGAFATSNSEILALLQHSRECPSCRAAAAEYALSRAPEEKPLLRAIAALRRLSLDVEQASSNPQKTGGTPFHPEPLSALQARFPAVLGRVFTSPDGVLEPANLFHFEDGLVIVLTCEQHGPGDRQLHASVGAHKDGPPGGMLAKIGNAEITRLEFLALARERLLALTGKDGWEFHAWTHQGSIPHFYRKA
jgi:hypothetical protein